MKKVTAFLLALCMVLALMPFGVMAAEASFKDGKTYIVVTPKVFPDNKGWTTSQDGDQGYSYLVGGKKGVPVAENPSVDVEIPKDGTYKIYVLGKDNTSDPGSRYFDVVLGDVSYRTGNHGKMGFNWQSSGELQITAGKAKLTLLDVSGNYARCAVIVITDDLTFKPGADDASVAAISAAAYDLSKVQATQAAIVKGESTGAMPDKAPATPEQPETPEKPASTELTLKTDKHYLVFDRTNFETTGDWQFLNESGIDYMLGGKSGYPLSANAEASIVLPAYGTYKAYALFKDFADSPGTRYFDIVIGNTQIQRMGSHGKDGFHWYATDEFEYFGGETTLELRDSSGNNARVAMVVITDDLDFNPPDDKSTYSALKEKLYKPGDISHDNSAVMAGRPSSEIAVNLNGAWMQFDVDPILMNDRTLVPFRAIFEALGCIVSWDDATQTAIGERNGVRISLPIGEEIASIGGKAKLLDQPAILKDGRTLVPLRVVSESLGAYVKWDDPTQSVLIIAEIPGETVFFTMNSFSEFGTWTREPRSSDAFEDSALFGRKPNVSNAKPEDADTVNYKPAVANFNVNGGTYYVWGHAKDYATNAQGSRYMQVSFDDMPLMENRLGDHGSDGYKWECIGTVELSAGVHQLKMHDTSGFYARFDGVLLTTDPNYVPSQVYETVAAIASPVDITDAINFPFPDYANEQANPTESYSIENEHTKVVFYKVPTSGGQVVQREIYSKANGAWIKTTGRDEDLGYIVMRADAASYVEDRELLNMHSAFTYNGTEFVGDTVNPYKAGNGTWFIPTDYTVDNNTVTLHAENETGIMTAKWSLDDNTAPLVSIDTTFAKDGYYTVGVHEGKGFALEQFEYALAPFRVAFKRVTDDAQLYTESYLFTPMGTHTLYPNNEYAALPVTKGVVVEPSWIPVRWVYADNNLFGITMNSGEGYHQGVAFAPVLGSAESKMAAGQTFNFKVRMVSTVADWFENYEDTVTNLFEVTDYRKNYVVSLNQAIFNTRKTVLDDKYGGWDVYDKAHYNMENGNRTSTANSMQALQDYLLTEDEEMLERRAIPTIANALTRGAIHFNRVGSSDEDDFKNVGAPSKIGNPIDGFNANVWGGMYEMTRGAVPFMHVQAVNKGQQVVTNSYGSIAPFMNDLTSYKYTGDQKYLDQAIETADRYLEEVVYAESLEKPVWGSFIWITYYANLGSLMDIYEVTGDKKYLDAADYTAKWMSTAFWVPGVDGTRKTDPFLVNDWEEIQKRVWIAKQETGRTYWWAGDHQMRIGREENLAENSESLKNITDNTKYVEGWVASRTGLGIEQASTFKNGLNIIMQSFVGDYMKLAAYTGNDYYSTLARNAILGRFSNYDGYYRAAYTTYQQEVNYPVEGPDYTGIYWHHIPPFLAMLEDFLINQTFAWSSQNIKFPSLRQNGYAYFNSNQYGHAPGKFYDEDGMWMWLDEGIVNIDTIQVDFLAAKKDGVLGIAFMNEDEVATTANITLGNKVPGGVSYNGTATLYDKTGKIGTVEIVNGAFTLTIPAKSLLAIKVNVEGIQAPAFASFNYSMTEADTGATVSDHKNGKGYVLQMTPDHYYAYVYTKSNQQQIQSATLTYTVNGETKTETATVYPFEFIVKVDDPNAEFTYTLSETALDGTVSELGGGTLMTAALSKEKGIQGPMLIEPSDAVVETSVVPTTTPTSEAKALKFDPFQMVCEVQGCDTDGRLRFVFSKEGLPFTPDEKNVIGLGLSGTLTRGETQYKFQTVVIGYEKRSGNKMVLITEPTKEVRADNFGSSSGGKYIWSEMTLSPIQ